MSVGSDLRKMGSFLEGFESGPGTVHGVEFVDRIDDDRGPTVDVEVAIAPSTDRERVDLSPNDAVIGSDGRLRLALETADPIVPAGERDIDVEPREATIEPDGTITATVRASVRKEPRATDPERRDLLGGVEAGHDGDAGGSEERDRDVPPFRDPELLAEVYESCDTFAEMSEAIGMDVTGETVRRYMIDYGIHEPNSYGASESGAPGEVCGGEPTQATKEAIQATEERIEAADPSEDDGGSENWSGGGSAGTDEEGTPVVATDGIGVHEDVSVDTLVETIPRASTVYEVQREIGLGREETRELLEKLDLIDLVAGRLATKNEREIGRETILERIRGAAETTPSPAS